MNPNESPARAAATLIYKGLQPKLVVSRDKEYRELLALYESDATFRSMVQDIAIGMGLQTLAINFEGAFFAPSAEDSRFAMRLQDIRLGMSPEEKALMVLIHVSVGALFYPTAERLNDDSNSPAAVLESEALGLLKTLCTRLAKQSEAERQDLPKELEPGWQCVLGKPESRPEQKNRTMYTLEGMVSNVFKQLCDHGFIYPEPGEEPLRYLATWKYTIQLRELLVSRIFQAAQTAAAHSERAGHA
jgi:hypothetical protein